MNVDKLKEQAEDIQPIENEEVSTTEELTPEQKEQQEQFLLTMCRKHFKSTLRALKDRMNKGLTLEEILQEIEEKRSPLSANQRQFVQGFKLEFIKKLL
jgi:type I restriction-modification system DNA methylase subunit